MGKMLHCQLYFDLFAFASRPGKMIPIRTFFINILTQTLFLPSFLRFSLFETGTDPVEKWGKGRDKKQSIPLQIFFLTVTYEGWVVTCQRLPSENEGPRFWATSSSVPGIAVIFRPMQVRQLQFRLVKFANRASLPNLT